MGQGVGALKKGGRSRTPGKLWTKGTKVTVKFLIQQLLAYDLLIETRKAADFKSLQVNYWEINQVTPNDKCTFSTKFAKKWSKTEKLNITIEIIFEMV